MTFWKLAQCSKHRIQFEVFWTVLWAAREICSEDSLLQYQSPPAVVKSSSSSQHPDDVNMKASPPGCCWVCGGCLRCRTCSRTWSRWFSMGFGWGSDGWRLSQVDLALRQSTVHQFKTNNSSHSHSSRRSKSHQRRTTQREPIQTRGGHAKSTQKLPGSSCCETTVLTTVPPRHSKNRWCSLKSFERIGFLSPPLGAWLGPLLGPSA